ncbi:MAG: hypothetical protein E7519_02605 [Ruminococcaceae bacterium]|nr:hypothetical protein [Oscillospiraceae bacterium]
MISYSKEKRAKTDYCNICGKFSELTWDHVPPQSCFNEYNTKFNGLFDGLPEEDKFKGLQQNGIRYRSICSNCNNNLLGSNYDPELNIFTKSVKELMVSSIKLPSKILVSVKVNKLARAVCGHLLAAKNFYDSEILIDKKLRKYFLNPELQPPQGMSLLIRIYPYSTIIVMRDAFIAKLGNSSIKFPSGVISIISAYPIAYILSGKGGNCGLLDLFTYCTSDIEQSVEIPIDFYSCFYPNTHEFRNLAWPCNISDEPDGAGMLLGYGHTLDQSIIGIRDLKLPK